MIDYARMQEMFAVTVPAWELVMRGTVMYFFSSWCSGSSCAATWERWGSRTF